ncbi:MAG: hypothetical protein LBI33_07505 [Propionibacteriaceae bacterium]|jgi:hypothetical protein|nr:hypothetical protein [Propionibacteriaceae bacterium]
MRDGDGQSGAGPGRTGHPVVATGFGAFGVFLPDGLAGRRIVARAEVLEHLVRISPHSLRMELITALGQATREMEPVTEQAAEAAVAPIRWLLAQVHDGLPIDEELGAVLTTYRLLRGSAGRRILAPAGYLGLRQADWLWDFLAWEAIESVPEGVVRDATILHLVCTSAGWWPSPDFLAEALGGLGWIFESGKPLGGEDVADFAQPVALVLGALNDLREGDTPIREVSPAERSFALAALMSAQPPSLVGLL